jgi:hypothetical protein
MLITEPEFEIQLAGISSYDQFDQWLSDDFFMWNLYANKWPRKKYLFMLFFFVFEEFMANSQSLSADVIRLVKNCLEQTAIPAAVP